MVGRHSASPVSYGSAIDGSPASRRLKEGPQCPHVTEVAGARHLATPRNALGRIRFSSYRRCQLDSLPMVEKISSRCPPDSLFARVRGAGPSFFLDSSEAGTKLGTHSYIGWRPFGVLRWRAGEGTWECQGSAQAVSGPAFPILRELLERYRLPPAKHAHFPGGAVGYFAYDLCRELEEIPSRAEDHLNLPDLYFAFYDAILSYDHQRSLYQAVSTGFPETGEAGVSRAAERLDELRQAIRAAESGEHPGEDVRQPATVTEPPVSNFTRDDYLAAVERAREYIRAGDIYQVNLSQRLSFPVEGDPFSLYERLRSSSPSPFSAYMDCEDFQILSGSPERFLRLQGPNVETRPVKGTRPRKRLPAADLAMARRLMNSQKDRAENVMIVDVERNDLGRICDYGSIRVPELLALESHATVFHLASTVNGKLRDGVDAVGAVEACFPGGSITGAPKISAMRIIDELEPSKRWAYTGSLGYLDFAGNADLNILIRSAFVHDGRGHYQVGGGIVADSDPAKEYEETLDKAKGLFLALGGGASETRELLRPFLART